MADVVTCVFRHQATPRNVHVQADSCLKKMERRVSRVLVTICIISLSAPVFLFIY